MSGIPGFVGRFDKNFVLKQKRRVFDGYGQHSKTSGSRLMIGLGFSSRGAHHGF
jgi:hypothetical protein